MFRIIPIHVDNRAIGQFEDPQIRRFNCVALDLRLYGRTTTEDIPEGYGAKDAAEDVALFMVTDLFIRPGDHNLLAYRTR